MTTSPVATATRSRPRTDVADAGASAPTDAPARSRWSVARLPVLGVAATLFTSAGLSGIMDAPDPHDSASSMAAHFLEYRDGILMAAPFGYLAAAALTAFALGLGRRIYRRGERTAGVVVGAAGAAAGLYFVMLHLVYTTLAYQVAASSADATKALFVPTILATPAFALATSALLGAAAFGAHRTGMLPRGWRIASAIGAAVAAVGVFGYAETGYLYPDVQQQWVGNVLLVWLFSTGVTLLVTGLRQRSRTT